VGFREGSHRHGQHLRERSLSSHLLHDHDHDHDHDHAEVKVGARSCASDAVCVVASG
jgi:hypothetical protein